jgi:hypothetical protein
MFVRSKVVKGRTYYQVISTCRDEDGRIRHRTHASLGTHPTIAEARRAALDRYFALHRKGKRFAKAAQAAWDKVVHLDFTFQRLRRHFGPYWQEPELEREGRRRRREAIARGRQARREARDQERQDRERFYETLEREFDRTHQALVTLGIAPDAEAIHDARRRKARECHPDHGGSEEAMVRVNAAAERLLKRASSGQQAAAADRPTDRPGIAGDAP